MLVGSRVVLREVRPDDRAAFVEHLATPEVTRFIPAPPADHEGFERFAHWAVRRRCEGLAVYFSVIPDGYDRAAGVICLHTHVPGDSQSGWDWGFALGPAWWGTGLFQLAARLTLDFAFATMGLPAVDAWSLVNNGRVHGAMAKLGAVPALVRDTQGPDGRFGTYIRWRMVASEARDRATSRPEPEAAARPLAAETKVDS